MHVRAIAGAVKTQELSAPAGVKTAVPDEQGGGFGKELRAALADVKGGVTPGTVVEIPTPKAMGSGAQVKLDAQPEKTQSSAAHAEAALDGEEQRVDAGMNGLAQGAPVVEEGLMPQAKVAEGMSRQAVVQAPAAVKPKLEDAKAAGTQEMETCAGGDVKGSACGLKAQDTKTAKSGKAVTKPAGEAKVVKEQAPAAAEVTAKGPVAFASEVVAAVPVAIDRERELTKRVASDALSIAGPKASTAAVKTRKGGGEAKEQIAAEKPVTAAAVSDPVEQGKAAGQLARVKDVPTVEVHSKTGNGAEAAASVIVSVSGMQSGQAVAGGHATKAAVSVTAAAPRTDTDVAEVKTLAATSNVLEVGLSDGTHGWLKVRAQMGQAGEIAASLVTSSAGQAEVLRRELPAISTYLAAESVDVSTVVVHAAGEAGGAQHAGANAGGEMQSGLMGAGAGASREERGTSGGGTRVLKQGLEDGTGAMWFNEVAPAAVLSGSYGSGRWLNVVA